MGSNQSISSVRCAAHPPTLFQCLLCRSQIKQMLATDVKSYLESNPDGVQQWFTLLRESGNGTRDLQHSTIAKSRICICHSCYVLLPPALTDTVLAGFVLQRICSLQQKIK